MYYFSLAIVIRRVWAHGVSLTQLSWRLEIARLCLLLSTVFVLFQTNIHQIVGNNFASTEANFHHQNWEASYYYVSTDDYISWRRSHKTTEFNHSWLISRTMLIISCRLQCLLDCLTFIARPVRWWIQKYRKMKCYLWMDNRHRRQM